MSICDYDEEQENKKKLDTSMRSAAGHSARKKTRQFPITNIEYSQECFVVTFSGNAMGAWKFVHYKTKIIFGNA